jgi:flagellar export protein FliJ
MRRFQFPLARLQRVRELGEELARSELLGAEAALSAAESQLEVARTELSGAENQIARLQADVKLSPGEVLAAQLTLPDLSTRVQARRAAVAQAAKAVELARVAWQSARIEVRALERLEERARDVFREEERAREDKVLAEVVDRKAAIDSAGNVGESR